MSHIVCECPSGLVVVTREFKVSDEDLLASKKARKRGTATTDLLKAITIRVEDPGPYRIQDEIDWSKSLQGDRAVTLLKTKIEDSGPEYEDHRPCPNQLCKEPVETTIDLTELPIKPLPEGSRDHVVSGCKTALTAELPKCGAMVGFRLLRGSDDRAMSRLQKQQEDKLSSAYLRYRTLWVRMKRELGEGERLDTPDDLFTKIPESDLQKWIRDMGRTDAAFLRAEFDRQDCGVEQEVQFSCPDCDHVWRDDVRFQADFLFPKFKGKTLTTS